MPSNKDLETKLDNLNLLVTEKFAIVNTNVEGVHRRLDTLNGKVANHESRLQTGELARNTLQVNFENLKGARAVPAWVAFVFPVGASILTGLAVYVITH